ncbi:MAG: DUF2238 domain-containing protein [Arenimonas sp.]
MTLNPIKKLSLLFVVSVFVITWINPRWPLEHGLHSSLTVVGLIWLVWHAKKYSMKNTDFFLVCFFIAIHCIAARWLYSNVPYDEWCKAFLNWSPQQAFGFERNHFDRLIHFLYGICFMPAVANFIRVKNNIRMGSALAIAMMLIMCSSLVYEWAEWAIAITMSPEQAEAYNGQQGDVWDAHMDMLLATLGATLTIPFLKKVNS